MYGERNWRYLIGIGALIVLLFIVIFLIIRGGGSDSAKVPETKRELASYVTDPNVVITQTTVGPITAAQNHYETRINVTNQQATIELIQGYDGNVIDSRSYPMTQAGFGEFLNSLKVAGYTQGSTDEKLADDSGYCATGQRYIFEVREASKVVQRFWTTSCGDTKTYKGRVSPTLNLFQRQIPDYNSVVQNANLNNSLF